MGVYVNLATGSQSITKAKPRVGLDRASAEVLLAKAAVLDPTIRTAYAAKDEVQTILEQTDAGAGDTYTLTIVLPRLAVGTFTTAGIAYDAVAATIETAIDVAATAAGVTDWTNADISVTMAGAAGVDDGTVTLTFDGASVTEQPVDAAVLTATGFTKTGVVARTTGGQVDREATQVMFDLGIVTGSLQKSGETPTWTKPTALLKRPRSGLIRDLAVQAVYEDGDDAALDAVIALYPRVAEL